MVKNTALSQNLEDYKKMRLSDIDSAYIFRAASKKTQWLSLAPSVSFNKNTGMNISLSAGNFVRYVQQRNRNAVERQRYIFEQAARIENEVIRAEDKYLQLTIDVRMLDLTVLDLRILNDQYQTLHKLFLPFTII